MSIPHFKSQDDWQEFLNIFDDQWQCKRAKLNRVKNDLFPEYKSWDQLTPKTLDIINDIVSNLVYEVERQFKETHKDYDLDDDIFIPYKSFKENVTEALEDAIDAYHIKKECPPCDTLD